MKPRAVTPSRSELIARAEAAAWITRLHGPNRTPEMERGFQRWLKERRENAQEFEGLTEVWDLVAGGAPTRGVPRIERWEHSAEARELEALRNKEHRRNTSAMRVWLTAAVVLLVFGAITIAALSVWPDMTYVTGIGEQRIVLLDDGTRISLNSDSRLSVNYDDKKRHVLLKRGEALFEVAKQPDWPFVVNAGGQQITALGTSFVVRTDADRTAITLVEGRVAVSSPELRETGATSTVQSTESSGSPAVPRENGPEKPYAATAASSTMTLSPGQRLTLARAAAPRLDTPAIEAVTAWRRGEVALDDTPLAEAVAEMNRYDKTRIVIASPDIESLIVSGLYHTGDNEGFARSVAAMYQLEMTERDGHIRLER